MTRSKYPITKGVQGVATPTPHIKFKKWDRQDNIGGFLWPFTHAKSCFHDLLVKFKRLIVVELIIGASD